MPYAPFYDLFPEVGQAETRTMITFRDPLLPDDRYVLMELYCDEIGCDCRRVFFNVYSEAKKGPPLINGKTQPAKVLYNVRLYNTYSGETDVASMPSYPPAELRQWAAGLANAVSCYKLSR